MCGFNSKLNYNTLQEYIKKYDLMCLSETECDFISENEMIEYKPFIMQKKCKSNRLGGIHGIYIFKKSHIA